MNNKGLEESLPIEIDWIQERAHRNEFQLTEHAHKERQEENIETREIREALMHCGMLESYPKDPRGPSCLVLGYSGSRPIHVVCGHAKNSWLLVITVYIPRPPKWVDPTTRGGIKDEETT